MARLIDPLPTLTPRQEDILRYIFTHFRETLSYPTKSQICRHFNAKSNNTAALVDPLFKKGILRRLSGRGSYELSEQGVTKIQRMGIRVPKYLLEEEAPTQQTEMSIS